jgi:hypothetical protein
LAGRYIDPGLRSWPEDPDTAAASQRAIYRLYTRKPVELPPSELHDDELWSELVTAVERRNAAAATATFVAIAEWWLEEYRATGTEAYDPENFSTFEPTPNAALAIALHMGMDIRLPGEEHRRFYYVALMPVEDKQP